MEAAAAAAVAAASQDSAGGDGAVEGRGEAAAAAVEVAAETVAAEPTANQEPPGDAAPGPSAAAANTAAAQQTLPLPSGASGPLPGLLPGPASDGSSSTSNNINNKNSSSSNAAFPRASATATAAQPPTATDATAISMPAAKKSKKGTATAVKGPRRAGGKGPKSARKGAAAVATKAAGNKSRGKKEPADGSVDGASDEEGGSDESESDHGPYCLCRGPDDHRWMISCEACEDWFHGECVNVTKEVGETLIQAYICPNCTVDSPTDGRTRLVTRYKKTCALEACKQPARILDPKAPKRQARSDLAAAAPTIPHSVFCSQEHCNVWWEQLVGTLPRKEGADGRGLSQPEFMALISSSSGRKTAKDGGSGNGWFVGQKPFDVPPDFWDTHDPKDALTTEEADLLALSSAERRGLADEVVMCRKMLQLLEMAASQRREAISAGRLESDGCGYDTALDTVGVQAQFAAFLRSPAGEAAFKAGKLEASPYVAPTTDEEQGGKEAAAIAAANALLASSSTSYLGPWEHPAKVAKTYICERRRCKPHTNWYAIHTRHVHFLLKELAAEAKVKLDMETRVRKNAAVRFFRRRVETSTVVRLDNPADDSEPEVGSTDDRARDEIMEGS